MTMDRVGSPSTTIEKEMGITPVEFMRLLPFALRESGYKVNGDIIIINESGRQLKIYLASQAERVIASIRVPVTTVKMEFSGYSEQELSAFLTRFDNTYRRGGG